VEDVSCAQRMMPFKVHSMINCVLTGVARILVVVFAMPWFLTSLPVLSTETDFYWKNPTLDVLQ